MKVWGSAGNFERKRVRTTIVKRATPVTIRVPAKGYNYRAITTSLMPNIIHSLDAANIHLLIEGLGKNEQGKGHNLYTIHDCFATTSAEMENVERVVKRVFAEMYFQKNYLESMHETFLAQLRSYTGDYSVPARGTPLQDSPSSDSGHLDPKVREEQPSSSPSQRHTHLKQGDEEKDPKGFEFININNRPHRIPRLPDFK